MFFCWLVWHTSCDKKRSLSPAKNALKLNKLAFQVGHIGIGELLLIRSHVFQAFCMPTLYQAHNAWHAFSYYINIAFLPPVSSKLAIFKSHLVIQLAFKII